MNQHFPRQVVRRKPFNFKNQPYVRFPVFLRVGKYFHQPFPPPHPQFSSRKFFMFGSRKAFTLIRSFQWHCRQISHQLGHTPGKRAFLVDTLALVKSLEAEGMPTKQAEAVTAALTHVLNETLENVAQSLVSQPELQKANMLQESNLSKFKVEVQGSQEYHFSMLQRETEKLRSDIDKMRIDVRHEMDKITAGHRLDLNLERGRVRDELAKQGAETTNLTNKLDREIHGLRAHLEAAKYDVIKYCIGTVVSISAVGLAIVRVLL